MKKGESYSIKAIAEKYDVDPDELGAMFKIFQVPGLGVNSYRRKNGVTVRAIRTNLNLGPKKGAKLLQKMAGSNEFLETVLHYAMRSRRGHTMKDGLRPKRLSSLLTLDVTTQIKIARSMIMELEKNVRSK